MIIASPKILTMRSTMPLIENGAVAVKNGIILSVGPKSLIIKHYPRHRVVYRENAVLMPGLVNLHTHLELPSLLDDLRAGSFSDWILNLVRAKKNLRNRDYRHAVRRNIETLIATGATTVGEICSHNVSPGLLKKSGLRAVVYQEIISMNPDAGPRLPPLSRTSALVRIGLSPHAPHTVSEAALRRISTISRRKKFPLSMHVAESPDETRLLQGRRSGLHELFRFAGWDTAWAPKGASSFEYLRRIGFLSPFLLAVHAVQVTDRDLAIIIKSKVSIAHCPRSNRELGVGRMPLKQMLDAGISVGLGTDSLASSPSLNLWDEMRYACKIHRRDGVGAGDILQLATMGGAKALGMNTAIGSLEPGKRADLIALPLPRKDTGDLCSDLLRETKSCMMSMVNGKMLYQAASEK